MIICGTPSSNLRHFGTFSHGMMKAAERSQHRIYRYAEGFGGTPRAREFRKRSGTGRWHAVRLHRVHLLPANSRADTMSGNVYTGKYLNANSL
jgi:hypothetical protein